MNVLERKNRRRESYWEVFRSRMKKKYLMWNSAPVTTLCVHNDKDALQLYTDGSFRTGAAFGWTLRDSSDQEIDSRSGSLGPFCTAFDGEVAAIENGISALLR
jgi:hypothetical protein